MNWKIEKGLPKDAETIAEFQVEMAHESEDTILNMDTVILGVKAGLEDSNKGTYYLVKSEDGKTAGSLFVTKEWSDWNNCWYWWIQSVYIRPKFRRKGAFSSLYSCVKEFANSAGAVSLRLYVDKDNIRAQKCYQRQGMSNCHYLMFEDSLVNS